MKYAMAMLLASLAGALLAGIGSPPQLVIVCERGGVTRDVSHVASGSQCVLHDRSGSATSAGSISVYEDSMAVP